MEIITYNIICYIHCAFTVSLKTMLSTLWCLISLETSIYLHKQVYFYEPVFQLKSEFISNRLSKFGSIEKLLWEATRGGEENTSQTVNRTPSKHTLNAGCQERCKGAQPNTPVAEHLLVIPSEWHFQIHTHTHTWCHLLPHSFKHTPSIGTIEHYLSLNRVSREMNWCIQHTDTHTNPLRHGDTRTVRPSWHLQALQWSMSSEFHLGRGIWPPTSVYDPSKGSLLIGLA